MSILLLSSPATPPCSCSLIVNKNYTKTLVQAFISCHLDYCNSLMYGVAVSLIRRVQCVQNAAMLGSSQERDDRNTSRQCYDTGFQSVNECVSNWPVTCTGHWSGPSIYLADDVQLLADSGRRLFRSANYTERASFLGHRTVLATETFLLQDLESGTICHRNCDTRISALDNLETC